LSSLQKPHFSQRTREMGHPVDSLSALHRSGKPLRHPKALGSMFLGRRSIARVQSRLGWVGRRTSAAESRGFAERFYPRGNPLRHLHRSATQSKNPTSSNTGKKWGGHR
jgi:hypothetical protein